MRKESFDRKNEKYGADRRFRTHPQTEQNGGTSTEDMKSKSLRNEMQIRGRVNESRRIKNFGRGKKQDF